MGSPEFKSDSETIEPTDKSSPEQEHVSGVNSGTNMTRRQMLLVTVLGAAGVTGLANAKEPPSPTPAPKPTGKQVNTDKSAQLERNGYDERMKALVDAYTKQYSNLTPLEISDLINLCTEPKDQDRYAALSILFERKTDIESSQKEFAKLVKRKITSLKAKYGYTQCDNLAEKIDENDKIADPVEKAAWLSLIIEQATRIGDKNVITKASTILSSVKEKKGGVVLSDADIIDINLDAITRAIAPAEKNGKSITMSVDARLDVARRTLDDLIPQAIATRNLSVAEKAKYWSCKYINSINKRSATTEEMIKLKKIQEDLLDTLKQLRALRTIETTYNKKREPPRTGKLEDTEAAHSTAARWLMETGDWNAGFMHLNKAAELSTNNKLDYAVKVAKLDPKAVNDNATASTLIETANAWISASKRIDYSTGRLYLKRAAEFAGRLKGMKGLNMKEDSARGKILNYLASKGVKVDLNSSSIENIRTFDLLNSANNNLDPQKGRFDLKNHILETQARDTKIAFPISITPNKDGTIEYVLTTTFTRLNGNDCIGITIPTADGGHSILISTAWGRQSCLCPNGEVPSDGTAIRKPGAIKNNIPYTFVIRVKSQANSTDNIQVNVLINGKEIPYLAFNGKSSEAKPHRAVGQLSQPGYSSIELSRLTDFSIRISKGSVNVNRTTDK